jgi:hypothetical protein
MTKLGTYFLLFGIGSFILNALGAEFIILSWVDAWGTAVGMGIRVAMIAIGLVLIGIGFSRKNAETDEPTPEPNE